MPRLRLSHRAHRRSRGTAERDLRLLWSLGHRRAGTVVRAGGRRDSRFGTRRRSYGAGRQPGLPGMRGSARDRRRRGPPHRGGLLRLRSALLLRDRRAGVGGLRPAPTTAIVRCPGRPTRAHGRSSVPRMRRSSALLDGRGRGGRRRMRVVRQPLHPAAPDRPTRRGWRVRRRRKLRRRETVLSSPPRSGLASRTARAGRTGPRGRGAALSPVLAGPRHRPGRGTSPAAPAPRVSPDRRNASLSRAPSRTVGRRSRP
jgi:hypothetical protein